MTCQFNQDLQCNNSSIAEAEKEAQLYQYTTQQEGLTHYRESSDEAFDG